MKIKAKNLNAHGLHDIVQTVSRQHYAGNIVFKKHPTSAGSFYSFTLTVIDSSKPGARRSNSGRRISAACWHAHRDYMRAIFEAHPDARLVSAIADYNGRAEFLDKFPATGDANIGSQMYPLAHSDACECEA